MLCPFRGWNNQKRSIKFSKPNAVNAVDALTFEHHTYPGVARAVGTPEWNSLGYFVGFYLLQQSGVAASTTVMRTGWEVSTKMQLLQGWQVSALRFVLFQQSLHSEAFTALFPPFVSLGLTLEMPFPIHSLYLHKYSIITENRQSLVCAHVGVTLRTVISST